MNKIIYAFISMYILVSGCTKNNDYYGVRPDERLKEEIDNYYKQLTEAQDGWIAYLFPNAGGGFTFKIKFDENNRVKMYANLQASTASTVKESSYRIRAAQLPSLYFDTYSYIHVLSDPDPSISGGALGRGRFSDFEYAIMSTSKDSIRLVGNFNQSEMLLVRAKPDQGDHYIEEVFQFNEDELSKLDKMSFYYKELVLGEHKFQITLNTELNSVSFRGVGAVDSINFFTPYAVTNSGIQLRRPLLVGKDRYELLTDFMLDVAQGKGTVKVGDKLAQINAVAQPLSREPQDATSMFIAIYQYKIRNGLHWNGQSDFLNFSSIPGYAGMSYIPRRYIDGTDVFYLFYNQGQNYVGPAVKTLIDGNGITRFNLLGFDYNNQSSITTDIANKVNDMTTLLRSESGYYVFRTGATAYDLVSVDDARLWIRLF